jgi:hypothetical protein
VTMTSAPRIGATGPGRISGTGAAAASSSRQAGAAFQVAEETSAAEAPAAEIAPLPDIAPVSLGAMLAAEALDRGPARDRAARRHGQAVLAGLTTLQRALLEDAGQDAAASLHRLAALITDMPQADDPQLAALLDTIALRARVELARLRG